ncbi:hypothetical protein FB565_003530 [Actinoplanes lutulentus]|uniref:STAS domain-containing protein n=1 Tax=Actinoplanes lutulentus TaxID=1287878 RepID=A0A327Z305_9ACTN|nr:STAS domain-containing protein [Actinoplanes lutulentus]MBB2943801.1 hypothetical protein [Actinoplanes lutulentus]RAK29343.1 STAS domain-containing protein [Actinoplanes lutulentus]
MATIFPVGAGVGRAEIPLLCADLAALLRGRPPGVVICEVTGPERPGLAVVEAVARLRLTTIGYGWQLHVRDPSPELRRLIGLLGLTEALLAPGEGGHR